ncbi:MAG: hypothetical protein ACOCWO_03735 [Candidatus Muiribacteriaceae bacterium]
MNKFEIITIISAFFSGMTFLLVLFLLKKRAENTGRQKMDSDADIQQYETQVYRYWHMDHLLNVEIERAERYEFKFTLLAVDFRKLLDHGDEQNIRNVMYSIFKRSIRILDFIVLSRKKGQVYLILSETNEDETKIVIDRIRKNIGESIFGRVRDKVRFAYVCYPADATSKDLIEEYIFSALSKADDSCPVISYSESLRRQ